MGKWGRNGVIGGTSCLGHGGKDSENPIRRLEVDRWSGW